MAKAKQMDIFAGNETMVADHLMSVLEPAIRNGVKVLKRLDAAKGTVDYENMDNLKQLVFNDKDAGRAFVNEFSEIQASSEEEVRENVEIAKWYLNEYYPSFR